MTEALTLEQAQHVQLLLNPIKWLGRLAELGASFALRKESLSPLSLYTTRRGLARATESYAQAAQMMKTVEQSVSRKRRN